MSWSEVLAFVPAMLFVAAAMLIAGRISNGAKNEWMEHFASTKARDEAPGMTPLQRGDRKALEAAYENAHVEYWAANQRGDRAGMDVALSKVDQYSNRLRETHWKALS